MAIELPSFITANKAPEPTSLSLTGTVDLQAASGDGARPTFEISAYNGGVMRVAGFYSPVVVDLAGVKASRPNIPILLDHDTSRIVGQAKNVSIGDDGIKVSGVVTGDDGDSAKVVGHAKNGFQWQASIGANVIRREFVEAGKSAEVNGRPVTGPLIIARESSLYEVSFVAVGADQTTAATVAAEHNPKPTGQEQEMKFDDWLKAKGFDAEKLGDAQVTVLRAAFDADQKPAENPDQKAPPTITATAGDPPVIADIKAIRAQYADEANRVHKINSIVAKYEVKDCQLDDGTKVENLAAHAIEAGMDVRDVELIALRASTPKAPAVHVRNHAVTADVLEASIAVGAGLRDIEKAYDEKTLEASHRAFRSGIGLQELLVQAAHSQGYHGGSIKSNLREVLQAAFTSLSLPGILSNVANKFLLDGFNSVDQAWREIAAIRSVSDFKTVTSYRMVGDNQFQQVGPDGEIKHGTLGEASFTNKADTYARMLSITRQDIINDDLGALTTEPRKRLGLGAAHKLNNVFWTAFNDNASLFPTDNSLGNYISGATTVLGSAGLGEAEVAFMELKSGDDYVGTTPRILLVPPALAVTAKELFVSTNMEGSTSRRASANIHAGLYKPVVARQLSSAVEWYLLADPNELATIEVAFLNGQQSPTIETAEADFNQLGIQMRGYFDFGVGLQEPLAGVKSKGAA